MASEWTTTTIAAIAAAHRNALVGGPFGSNLGSKDYVEAGVPVIRGQNMGCGRWVAGDFVFVTEEKAAQLAANKARPRDLIFTQRGTLGQVAIVPAGEFEEYVVSQSQMKVTVDPAKADVEFLFYLFNSEEQQAYIRNCAVQNGVPHTNLTQLKQTPVNLPSLTDQRAIAMTLGALDEEIESLQKRSRTLESIAQAIFKSWFVDFDPVRAKAEGREPEGMDATAALFPAAFTESELGDIPKGWTVQHIGDCAVIVGGSTPSTYRAAYWDGGEHCWATPKDLSANKSPVLLSTERRVTDEGLKSISSGLLPVGTVLLSSRAPIGYLVIAKVPTAINQGFIALKPVGDISSEFLILWAAQAMETIKSLANGSTFQEISKRNFRTIQLVCPSADVLDAFNAIVKPLYDRITTNAEQMEALSHIRDTLLPRLISGKLRVPEAEKLVEAAL